MKPIADRLAGLAQCAGRDLPIRLTWPQAVCKPAVRASQCRGLMLCGMDDICIDGISLTVRPIRGTDVTRLERMFTRLSAESVRFRFFSPIHQLPRPWLLRLTHVDHGRRDALVALHGDEIIAVARYDAIDDKEPRLRSRSSTDGSIGVSVFRSRPGSRSWRVRAASKCSSRTSFLRTGRRSRSCASS
jgi:hypothetical protein